MIPNVSAIYRDLATMSDPQTFRGQQAPTYASYQADPYTLKQKRHNQLMEKLRNSQKQVSYMNQELGVQGASGQLSFREPSYPSYTPTQTIEINNDMPFFNRMNTEKGSSSKWKPMNIKYRHIEDFKKPEPQPPVIPYIPQERPKAALQKQFYEQPALKSQQQVKQEQKSPEITPTKQVEIQKSSETSYGQTWMNRESKFQQKLESYYELCKKRPVSAKAQEGPIPTTSKTKFQRSTNKPPVMELQKAIKMLSLD